MGDDIQKATQRGKRILLSFFILGRKDGWDGKSLWGGVGKDGVGLLRSLGQSNLFSALHLTLKRDIAL